MIKATFYASVSFPDGLYSLEFAIATAPAVGWTVMGLVPGEPYVVGAVVLELGAEERLQIWPEKSSWYHCHDPNDFSFRREEAEAERAEKVRRLLEHGFGEVPLQLKPYPVF